jgi:hypothetical protein
MIALYGLEEWGPHPRGRGPERRPWIAQLLGLDAKRGYERRFVNGSRDYTDADRKGRGTKLYFQLEHGRLYEVNRWRTRAKEERFFVRVNDTGDVVGVAQDDVTRILEEAQCTRDEAIRQSLAALDAPTAAASASA